MHYDPFDVYRVLRQVNPSPYMYYVRHPEATLVGSSPEPMVQLLDGRVISRPIAGTRRRGRTEADDRRMAAELAEHPKERAEHVMLVDLARNDVGRVVKFGTERMEEFMVLERYSHVMHLTSQVAGDLRDDANAVDVLRATFPAGTVSGAPKVRAMEIIDELEPAKRGAYAGVVGYLDFSGQPRHRHRHPHHDLARRSRERAGGRGHRRRFGSRRRRPRVPQQGAGAAHRRRRRPPARPARQSECARMTAVDDLAALRAGTGCVDRSDRGFVTVTGPDAFSFLQALVSADLDGLTDGDAVHSLLLTPQGKLDVDFRLVRVGDDAWLDCDPGLGAQLVASLLRFKIRVQADVTDRTGEFGMLSYFGAGPPTSRFRPNCGSFRPGGDTTCSVRGRRSRPSSTSSTRPRSTRGASRRESRCSPPTSTARPSRRKRSSRRTRCRSPRDASSARSSCAGSTAGATSTGSCGASPRLEGDWPEPGAEVVVDGKVVGALTSVAPRELPTGALGYVRREVEPPATVELRWAGGTARAVI